MPETTLYGLKACDTCRKALRELEAAGRDVRFVDVRAEPVDRDRLTAWHARFGEALINTRSTTWRGLDAVSRDRAATPEGAVALLTDHPALMKRPVIEDGTSTHMGWTAPVRSALGLGS